ncbi:DUF421 domain-containing protein [Mobilicoccus pelagius]|uniref:YetF C-terminal domain-containing protein n=1 Tax=Mobilicoccus pelagius NBRC 104925 TaxID=1089455 RepID=H5UTM0_9MICO|nr:YetF domain-containing protein [Mobilicoccus pelagius]GAB49078.1 hypothetical protein MOPEL_096_00850 [Mobilicoccus pelagius NBRC 104925]
MADLLAITPLQAAAVVVSAAGMYVAFLVLVRVFGARVLARMSTFDLVVTLMLGAIAGRVILGDTPVLAAGVLGLGTLLLLEVGVGRLRTIPRIHRWLTPDPILIVDRGEIVDEGLRRAHITTDEVRGALRTHGIRHLDELAYGIFEPTGTISLLRAGRDVDPRILADVVDATGRPVLPYEE